MISIVIPAYNASAFIERALSSVLNQTYKDYEVIIVDDGSVDNTVDIVEQHPLAVTLIKQSNAGASAARNKGIEHAKGEYIAFLDSDDEWLPNKLEIQHACMESNSHWLASYTKEVKENITDINSEVQTQDKDLNAIFSAPYLTTSTFMVKATVIKNIKGFDESLNTAEDIDLYLKISKLGAVGEIQKLLVVKHEIENSLGAQMSSYADNLMVIDRFFVNYKSTLPNDFEALYTKMKVHIYNAWAKDHLYRNETKKSLCVLVKSLKTKITFLAITLICKSFIKSLVLKVSFKK
ncbi:MAG: glycosyltransferase family 2 protein [Colwellia sp.]